MRNRLLIVAMATLLLTSIFTLFFLCARTCPVEVEASDGYKVHNLNTGLNYTTIQGAINAPETLNEHMILVDAGVYLENVVVNKSVKLVGENEATTIIDGSSMGNVVYVTAHSVTVTGFTVRNSGTAQWDSGIRFNDCNNGNVTGNTVKNCDNGIRLMWCDNCLIQGNYIHEPLVLHQDIVALDSNYCTIENNTAMNSANGIRWDASHHLLIKGNILKNNKSGIATSGVYQSLIIENTFINNSDYAAWFAGSTGNTLSHNSFINNTRQINMVEGSTNFVWNDGYPSGGNFWSDYTGVDMKSGLSQNESGKDGIGDTPKIIDANNRDAYPLMCQWNAFPVNNMDSELGYNTIQEAIDAPETLNGHTIYVRPGTYYEHVQITKSLEAVG